MNAEGEERVLEMENSVESTSSLDSERRQSSEACCSAADARLNEETAAPMESVLLSETSCHVEENSSSKETTKPAFAMGDHVYQWCSFAGIPAVFQHHAIVLDATFCQQTQQWMLQIADFSNLEMSAESDDRNNPMLSSSKPPTKKSLMGSHPAGKGGCIRTYEVPADSSTDKWHKVEYSAGWWKRHTWRTGTCTAAECDAPGLVRARVQFLINRADLLPPYSAVGSNCECVAVWCKTGTWATLQATSWLSLTAAGQAKSAVTAATAVAGTQVTVPAAGLWGWLGYTTHVSLAATQPYLIPAIAAYGVVTAGGPALWLLRAKKHWASTTEKLNTSFWDDAVNHPDVFVECITHWSSQHEPTDGGPRDLPTVTQSENEAIQTPSPSGDAGDDVSALSSPSVAPTSPLIDVDAFS
jgi:hypothetical protein